MRLPLAGVRPPAATPDGHLLDRFRTHRDEAAFAELVRRHGPLVWGVCRRTLSAADAEDAFQAVFLVMFRRAAGFNPAVGLAPWLYRTAVLTARTARRTLARRRTVPLPPGFDRAARPVPPPVDVDALLLRLPARERAAVVLCHLQGLTRAEAAKRLGIPEGTLSARLSRALARLRQCPEPLAVPAGLTAATVRAGTLYQAGGAVPPAVAGLIRGGLTMTGWKSAAAAGLVLAAVAAAGVGLRAGPDEKPAADPVAAAEERLAEAVKKARLADERRAEAQDAVEQARRLLDGARAKADGRPAGGLVLTDAPNPYATRFRLTEPTAAGPLDFGTSTPAGLTVLLARTRAARPAEPLSLDVAPYLTVEQLGELLKAVKAAGYARVHYTGPDKFDLKKLAAGPGRTFQQARYRDMGRLVFGGSTQEREADPPPREPVVKVLTAEQAMYRGPLDLGGLK